MILNIHPNNGLAIYDQIVRQVNFAVASGALRSGELVPSVRQLARELAINPNTVARAYQQLQSQEVIEPVRGQGLQVTATALKRCRQARIQMIRERLRSVMQEAKQSRLEFDQLRDLVGRELAVVQRAQNEEKPSDARNSTG